MEKSEFCLCSESLNSSQVNCRGGNGFTFGQLKMRVGWGGVFRFRVAHVVPDSVFQSIDQSFAAAKWLPVGNALVPGEEPSHQMSNVLNSDINPNSNQGCFISTVERSNTSPGATAWFCQ